MGFPDLGSICSDFLFKFLVIGSAGTGKSCLLHQFIENKCEFLGVVLGALNCGRGHGGGRGRAGRRYNSSAGCLALAFARSSLSLSHPSNENGLVQSEEAREDRESFEPLHCLFSPSHSQSNRTPTTQSAWSLDLGWSTWVERL